MGPDMDNVSQPSRQNSRKTGVWQRLVEPSKAHHYSENGQQARTLSALLFVLFVL